LRSANSVSESDTSIVPFTGIDGDDVAILQQRNRSADRCFRPDMANAKAARRAEKRPS